MKALILLGLMTCVAPLAFAVQPNGEFCGTVVKVEFKEAHGTDYDTWIFADGTRMPSMAPRAYVVSAIANELRVCGSLDRTGTLIYRFKSIGR